MHDIFQLIEQARSSITCPACGRNFEAKEIRFKGSMDHSFVLQTSCVNNHSLIYTTWITSTVPMILRDHSTPLDSDDLITLNKALKHFKGDFNALWGKKG